MQPADRNRSPRIKVNYTQSGVLRYPTRIMYTSTVTQKGQIIIPVPQLRKLGFDEGTKVVIVEADGGIEVRPLARDYAGLLSGEDSARHALLDKRRKETARDDDRAG